jgi:hypothetical protein
MNDTSYENREAARKDLLEMLTTLDAKFGRQAASTGLVVDLLKDVVIHQLFGLADELRARLDLVEEAQLHYGGVFDKDAGGYSKNTLCTHRGTLWICKADKITLSEPGTDNDWKLMVKSNTRSTGRYSK